jgi:hypothetical protein
MRDTGSDQAKSSIQSMLDRYLDKTDTNALAPVDTTSSTPQILPPGPVSMYVPAGKEPKKEEPLTH